MLRRIRSALYCLQPTCITAVLMLHQYSLFMFFKLFFLPCSVHSVLTREPAASSCRPTSTCVLGVAVCCGLWDVGERNASRIVLSCVCTVLVLIWVEVWYAVFRPTAMHEVSVALSVFVCAAVRIRVCARALLNSCLILFRIAQCVY